MFYPMLSTATLKDFHGTIRKCLNEDDLTPVGHMKPYGVREYPDWKEQLDRIETELDCRSENYMPISISLPNSLSKPKPIEFILYERIKVCLEYEDQLPPAAEKPYGVRVYSDWKAQAQQFEKALENIGYPYTKIQW